MVPQDQHKDQTYFLYQIRGEQLPHVMFPLGDLTKDQVRQEAEKRKIHVSAKKDSTGICFVGKVNVHQFLKEKLGENPGQIVDKEGRVLGSHQGLWFYTVGQRYGLELDKKKIVKFYPQLDKERIPAFYVIAKDQESNHLVVGLKAEAYKDEFEVGEVTWINQDPELDQVLVRIRNTGELHPARLKKVSTNRYHLKLEKPIFGVAEGQFAVFYHPISQDKILCLGGGMILLK
jgi:tRNA-specific 2-thiouridylase